MNSEYWKSAKCLGFSRYECSNYGNIRNILNKETIDINGDHLICELLNDENKSQHIYLHRLFTNLFTVPNTLQHSKL